MIVTISTTFFLILVFIYVFLVLNFVLFPLISSEIFTISSDKSDREGNIGNFFFEILFVSSFTTSSAGFGKFDIQNVILFQIKVFGRNIKETTLAKFFAYLYIFTTSNEQTFHYNDKKLFILKDATQICSTFVRLKSWCLNQDQWTCAKVISRVCQDLQKSF